MPPSGVEPGFTAWEDGPRRGRKGWIYRRLQAIRRVWPGLGSGGIGRDSVGFGQRKGAAAHRSKASPAVSSVPTMPRISAFYGIVITMYSNDHAPPHFHARYGEFEAKIAIGSGDLIAGQLPGRALRLVRE